MATPIAVELSPGYFADPHCAAVLVEACSVGAGGDGCVLSQAAPPGSVGAAAFVGSDRDTQHHVRVTVAAGNGKAQQLRRREITFREEDAADERCRATGLVIASLASSHHGDADPADRQREDASARDSGSTDRERELSTGTVDGVFLAATGGAGDGLQGGPGRWGGSAQIGYASSRTPWFASLSASYWRAMRDPVPGLSVTWNTFGCGGGIGAPIGVAHATLRFKLEGVLERTLASLTDGGLDATAQVWVPGTRAGLELLLPVTPRFGLVAGLEAFARAHPVVIRSSGAVVANTPSGGYHGYFGILFHLGD